jgi:prepilin-type N-terminal cleavage/methylation domain-containing protein
MAARMDTVLHRATARHSEAGVSLIELLVGIAIMSVISTMLLMGWFALSDSYSFSIKSADARDSGREALSRLQREIRDAQKPTIGSGTASDAILYRARPYTIALFTSFNEAGNDTMDWSGGIAVSTTPHLVVYRLYTDGEIWRFEDLDGDRVIDMTSGIFDMSGSTPPEFQLSEQVNGEGASELVSDVVNWSLTPHTPLFSYNVYGTDPVTGAVVLQTEDLLIGADRYKAVAVNIDLLVDLNPARAPVYADLRATAQLRNNR